MATSRTSSLNLGLASLPETKGEDFPEFVRIYNALNLIASALDTYTGTLVPDSSEWPELTALDTLRVQNMCRLFVQFYEDIVPGAPIYLFDDGSGVCKAKKASAGISLAQADGFSGTDTLTGEWGYVYLGHGLNPYISGLTPGRLYFLSQVTPGTITINRPATGVVQIVGRAISENLMWWGGPNYELDVTP